jgi:hypothetical protein
MNVANKLNDLWWAGYCHDVIEYTRDTLADPDGAQKRVNYMEEHIHVCTTCYLANILKNMEADVAKELGPDVVALFNDGLDVTKLEGFQEAFKKVRSKYPSRVLVGFTQIMSERQGKPYPGRPSEEK